MFINLKKESKMRKLDWKHHPNDLGGKQAKLFFENGYGVSIVFGILFYSNGIDTYEVAVLKGDKDNWKITYNTPITDDVLGYLTMDEVQEVIDRVEKL